MHSYYCQRCHVIIAPQHYGRAPKFCSDNCRKRSWDKHHKRATSAKPSPQATAVYRRLAFKYHPDRSPHTAEVMRDLNELWQAVIRG